MRNNNIKPIKRSALRIKLGKLYYRCKRYYSWYFSNAKYAKTIDSNILKHTIFRHQTPTLRKLDSVDMQLQYNKEHNLKIAISKLNNLIIKPGETFSYWKRIGNPSKRKGYLPGVVLFYGKTIQGIGGGLCQLSNMIYWMVLHSELTITERYRHSYDVFPDNNRKQPFGSGATCVYNYRDLQFINNTNKTFQLIFNIKNNQLIGKIVCSEKPVYSYKIYQEKHAITHEPWGGYIRHNLIKRKIFNNSGKLIDDHIVSENHALMMYQPYISE